MHLHAFIGKEAQRLPLEVSSRIAWDSQSSLDSKASPTSIPPSLAVAGPKVHTRSSVLDPWNGNDARRWGRGWERAWLPTQATCGVCLPTEWLPCSGHRCLLCQMTLVRTVSMGQMAANLNDPYKRGLGARSSFLPGLPGTATNLPS